MTYEELLSVADRDNLIVQERVMCGHDGLIIGRRIAIRKTIETQKQKACVLAEELGHHHTSVGNILDLSEAQNRKQERQARLWAYNKQIGLLGLVRAYERNCSSAHEIAEYLEVTEEFLHEAIECYRDKYGICTNVDNYTIYFIPQLTVMKRI